MTVVKKEREQQRLLRLALKPQGLKVTEAVSDWKPSLEFVARRVKSTRHSLLGCLCIIYLNVSDSVSESKQRLVRV